MRILHITSDFPDIFNPHKTKAVLNIINNADSIKHVIISLNRCPFSINTKIIKDYNLYAVKYWGLPHGILLSFFLNRLSRRLKNLIDEENINFDYIHAHKLTFEGIVGQNLSKFYNSPLLCTIRGNTDIKVMKYKPLSRALYKNILENSYKIIYISPWPKRIIQDFLNLDKEKNSTLIPNIVNFVNDNIANKKNISISFSNKFCSVFHLKYYKIKNIKRLIQAFDIARKKYPNLELEIIGSGTENEYNFIRKLIRKSDSSKYIKMLGFIDNIQIIKSFCNYAGMLLPSYPETFGMVYLEAILSGVPVLHSRNTGIDGYFVDVNFAVAVNHKSLNDIASGIIKLLENQIEYKEEIIKFNKLGKDKFFKKESIISRYSEIII
jgi:glycosyltransferase involved in cell wall biosynthesis